jgi:predicted SAM-dependent methyltransferase
MIWSALQAARKRLRPRPKDTKKIQFACGPTALPGWDNCDIEIDIRLPLPFADKSYDFAYIEHGIEHIQYQEAQFFVKEVKRILKPGGVFRIATPSFTKLYQHMTQEYIEYSFSKGVAPTRSFAAAINALFYGHGHKFIHDVESLSAILHDAGYCRVVERAVGESDHPELRNVEQHWRCVGPQLNAQETIVLEGTVPAEGRRRRPFQAAVRPPQP